MTETEARQVLLLQAHETRRENPHWSADDRSWATRQAVATVGEQATPERFVVARAVIALQRLVPRDDGARRWLARRGWHPAWVLLAVVLGGVFGLGVDQLGLPQRVNLLAPAVWAVVAWNLAVYLTLVLPLPTPGLRDALARWGRGREGGAGELWLRHAGPLLGHRAALVLHAAAAALALGLVAGLYLRGLVLDYRAGWQSTFLDAATVQQLLALLLAPARLLTGIAMPDVAPLQVGPGADAQASAAPWIHLYAATLALFVVLPRGLLALRAAAGAARLAQRFPLPLDTPYFEALHPLMRPGQPRAVRLLWRSEVPLLTLLGRAVGTLDAPLTLLHSEEGDELQLLPAPASLDAAPLPALAAPPSPPSPPSLWRRWSARWPSAWSAPRSDTARQLERLREQVDAMLLVTRAGAERPPWLAALQRPVVVLIDGPAGSAGDTAALSLHALADGWLADGRLFDALDTALPGDPRLQRLRATWTARQQARFDASVAELAATLASVACAHEAVPDAGLLRQRASEADAARAQLLQRLEAELRAHSSRLAALLGQAEVADDSLQAVPAAAAALRGRVGEGRAALVGGVVTGALAGLKADVLSGGLTMGAGAVAGALIGAVGAFGAARGLNVVRGTDRSFVAWNEGSLVLVTEALLLRCLVLAHALPAAAARERLAPALSAQQPALTQLWKSRQGRYDNAGEAEALAQALHQPLADTLRAALAAPSSPASPSSHPSTRSPHDRPPAAAAPAAPVPRQ